MWPLSVFLALDHQVRQRKRPDIVCAKARQQWHKFLLLNQHIYSHIWLNIFMNSCAFDFMFVEDVTLSSLCAAALELTAAPLR